MGKKNYYVPSIYKKKGKGDNLTNLKAAYYFGKWLLTKCIKGWFNCKQQCFE